MGPEAPKRSNEQSTTETGTQMARPQRATHRELLYNNSNSNANGHLFSLAWLSKDNGSGSERKLVLGRTATTLKTLAMVETAWCKTKT